MYFIVVIHQMYFDTASEEEKKSLKTPKGQSESVILQIINQ